MGKSNLTREQIWDRKYVIDNLNPKRVPYLHTFAIHSGKCKVCGVRLVDEVYTDDHGVMRVRMWCAVISPEEVSWFREEGSL